MSVTVFNIGVTFSTTLSLQNQPVQGLLNVSARRTARIYVKTVLALNPLAKIHIMLVCVMGILFQVSWLVPTRIKLSYTIRIYHLVAKTYLCLMCYLCQPKVEEAKESFTLSTRTCASLLLSHWENCHNLVQPKCTMPHHTINQTV